MAKKKVALPFVVAPRREPIAELVGTEESGQFKIERRGYLTVAEKSFIQQASASDETIGRLNRLAGRIAREKGVQPQEVVNELSSGDFSSSLLEGYESEIDDIVTVMATFEQRRKIVAASCLLYFRISQDWSIEDTLDLHPDLIEALYLLFCDEDVKSVEAFEKIESEGTSGGK
jgi:hypothetical protein